MAKQAVLFLIAVIGAAIGGTVVYFLLAIPRDVRADHLLREAHTAMQKHQTQVARTKLEQLIREYPRTDAGAAAVVASLRIEADARQQAEQKLEELRRQNAALTNRIVALENERAAAAAASAAAAKAPPAKVSSPAKKKKPTTYTTKRPVRRTTSRRRH